MPGLPRLRGPEAGGLRPEQALFRLAQHDAGLRAAHPGGEAEPDKREEACAVNKTTRPKRSDGTFERSGGAPSVRGNVLVLRNIDDIFPEYRPEKGRVYEAEIVLPQRKKAHGRSFWRSGFCIVDIGGKRIALRPGEYREVGA